LLLLLLLLLLLIDGKMKRAGFRFEIHLQIDDANST